MVGLAIVPSVSSRPSSAIVTLLGESDAGGPLLAEELLLLGLAIEGRLGRLLAAQGWPSLLQLRVLALLVREGEIEPRHVAQTLAVHPASLHHTLQQLIHIGAVRQEPHPTDGRRRFLSITDAGRELYLTLRQPIESDLRALTSDVSVDDERSIREMIEALRTRLGVGEEEVVRPQGYRARLGP